MRPAVTAARSRRESQVVPLRGGGEATRPLQRSVCATAGRAGTRALCAVVLAVVYVLALPGAALGNHSGGCPDGLVYVQTGIFTGTSTAGSSDRADNAAGVCIDSVGIVVPSWGFFDGVLVEIGTGPATTVYAVVDGDDANTDPSATDQSAGYFGVNTGFETGTKGPCPPNNSGTGTNSGGCLYLRPGGPAIAGVPIICGNTDGPSWDSSTADGCYLP